MSRERNSAILIVASLIVFLAACDDLLPLPEKPENCIRYVYSENSLNDPPENQWRDTIPTLQEALVEAQQLIDTGECTDHVEIWVASGTYNPKQGLEQLQLPDDEREVTFQLISGVSLYGGFEGNETELEDRDTETNRAVLSGNIDDNPDNDTPLKSYHVVTGADDSTIDGFIIRFGLASKDSMVADQSVVNGGGMYNIGVSPNVRHCSFLNNEADSLGGGMYNEASSPIIENCVFRTNEAQRGGAIANRVGSHPRITGTVFNFNGANNGGAIANEAATADVTNCFFFGNSAVTAGGSVYGNRSTLRFTNCLFAKNIAGQNGGALAIRNIASAHIYGCTIWDNSSRYGGGIWNDESDVSAANNILWGNFAEVEGWQVLNGKQSSSTIIYSDVEGGCPVPSCTDSTEGNINLDPDFVTFEPSYYAGDSALNLGSPCEGAGSNAAIPADAMDLDGDGNFEEAIPVDLLGYPRIVVKKVDMGALENQESLK